MHKRVHIIRDNKKLISNQTLEVVTSLSHNQGLATEAAKEVLKLAKKKGLQRLYSFTTKQNSPSERVMQKIGMKKVGEFEHPNLSSDSPLRTHVLYQIDL